MSLTDPRRTAAGVLFLLSTTLISGCGGADGPADGRPATTPSSRSTEQSPPKAEIRRDTAPILRRFPQFGTVTGVEWASAPLGKADSRVPGPTDYRLSGVATLAKADVRRLLEEYAWTPSAEPPDVLAIIAPGVPEESETSKASKTPTGSTASTASKGIAWRSSEAFTSAVTGDVYSATFHLDPATGTMVFDAVNPTVTDGT
ncbi:hypothetical protein ACFXGT_09195 [Streptomyces sp. NPDC059352]|uniref:hypothetical protein n=1 Tax=Streptomyces sp. NPDC059352 TaxID=3346810 RepID=UPI0036CD3145